MRRICLLSIIISLLSVISACKKDSSIGANILPNGDLLNVHFTDTFTVTAKTLADTFLRTDKLSKNYLGVVNDAQSGFYKAATVMELDRPNLVYDDTLGPFTLDSVVLFMQYGAVYGDTTIPQNFTVSTINNKIDENSLYYSNTTLFPPASQIGSVSNYYIHPTSTVSTFIGDSIGTPSTLRIKLNDYVGYSILNLGQNILRDSLQFKNAFPGIIVQNSNNSGNAMVEINLASTKTGINIFYKNKYGDSRQMILYSNILKVTNGVIGTRQNSINLFTNTLASPVLNTISSGLQNDSINYIIGQGATIVKVGMPTLNNLGKVAVNQAKLVVTQVRPNGSSALSAPSFLLLLKRNAASGLLDIFLTGDGAALMDTSRTDLSGNKIVTYNFDISKYVQAVSKGMETNTDLYIATYRSAGTDPATNLLNSIVNGSLVNFSFSPARVIVAGPTYSDPSYRMKLNLTYTLIP